MTFRIYTEKKTGFQTETLELTHQLAQQLSLDVQLRVFNGYDVKNLDESYKQQAITSIFSEVMVDEVFDSLPINSGEVLAREPLPGQYDQRADSAMQCLGLLDPTTQASVKTFQVVQFDRPLSEKERQSFLNYWINPIEARVKQLDIDYEESDETEEGLDLRDFRNWSHEKCETYLNDAKAAMTSDDLLLIQSWFNKMDRNPSETELKVLDTYWSDHCRHTTFETEITEITIEKSDIADDLKKALDIYEEYRKETGRIRKPSTLMEMATLPGRAMSKSEAGKDIEVSDEVNACSVRIEVTTPHGKEPWYLMFKNETHNHPTEIEPFGGASTCIGGAIRDPLSGRSYVYQAMRISGCGDVTQELSETMTNKLPQRVIAAKATKGNSSYGNQIGVATTFVKEIYHPNYGAKHLELGAVVGAVPCANVVRQKPEAGDIVILLGGRTGRDGIGGATGSSQAHNQKSLTLCASEVQKGNAPEERKIQRLFRDIEVAQIIKKCNDFGAGGVCVAIGELADGVRIDLDAVPVKYIGLTATELAISESQERMAVVVDPKDVDLFLKKSIGENIEATIVGIITAEPQLTMVFHNEKVVDLPRALIDTNGVRQTTRVILTKPTYIEPNHTEFSETSLLKALGSINACSQKGLIENFDASIGASTVLFPLGGIHQLTPVQAGVQKISVEQSTTSTCSLLAYGFVPELSERNMFLSAQGAVLESIAKTIAVGGAIDKIYFSMQEYFPRLKNDEKKWGDVVQALLGAMSVQKEFGRAAIGGKDSMSGSYNELEVLKTLVSFACSTAEVSSIISPELKKAGNELYLVPAKHLSNGLFDLSKIHRDYTEIEKRITDKEIVSAYVVENGIAVSLIVMALGNGLGVEIDTNLNLLENMPASIIVEYPHQSAGTEWIRLGKVTARELSFNGIKLSYERCHDAYLYGLDFLYPVKTKKSFDSLPKIDFHTSKKFSSEAVSETVKVVIPVFPGTNCETDTGRAFIKAGAEVKYSVFRNLNSDVLNQSIEELATAIDNANILALAGGFSSGDEPDGSAKFIVNVLRNEKIKDAVHRLLKRDGLILGICNGFQALIKTGLLPYGEIRAMQSNDCTLTHNDINRHISSIVRTRITSNASPWLRDANVGDVLSVPISHGEGRFVATDLHLKQLIEAGQVALQYVDDKGNPTMDPQYNVNGSFGAVESLISPCGHILGKMGHSERSQEDLYKNIPGGSDFNLIASGVNYFKQH